MRSLQVVRPLESREAAKPPVHCPFTLCLSGVDLTPGLGFSNPPDLLCDVSLAVLNALRGPRGSASVPLPSDEESWELGVRADGRDLLFSLYKSGPVASLAYFERRLPADAVRLGLQHAIRQQLEPGRELGVGVRRSLASTELQLRAPFPFCVAPKRKTICFREKQPPFELGCEASLYENAEAPLAPEVERADLLPLLAEGNLRFGFGRSSCEIAKSQVFLDSERLLQLAQCALESHVTARPTYRRISLSRASIALRRGSGDAAVELQILGQGNGARAQLTCELPALSFARSVARFAIQIAERFRTADPSQQYNLRLRSLVSAAAALLEALRLDPRDESRVNPSPEVYKRFVPRLRRARGYWENGAKIRFSPHWEAIVPSIDLRGTFLCGERLLIGSANETACLDRRSGEVLWKQPTRPASCVVSPAGLLRVEPSGRVQSLHLEDGSVRFTTRVAPRVGGGAVGSVLYGGGLPKLLVLAEGDRQISALDLLTGEPRWRYSARRAISPKLRRSGRLIIVAGGDSQMLALDASTGQVVWCLKSRLPFTGDLAQDAEGAFAICGASGGVFQLVRFDPWTGEFAWSMDLDARPIPGRAPLLTPTEVIVPVLDESGVGAVAYDRATGGKLWEHEPGLATQGSAWLVVDDLVLVNSGAGTLLALSARTGAPRYNHVFTRSSDEDQPRSLDLVLRDGALFVPQAQVTVLRPTDGEILGQVESDLVPDLIRVDERCDVFIAEESGYVAAFSAAPRLTLLG